MHDAVREEAHPYDSFEVRRSFRFLSVDGTCYIVGLAFLDQATVLPAFLATLTGSSALIGAIIAIRPAGLFLPQLWSAHYLSGRVLHKPYLIKVAIVARIAIALLALVLLFARPDQRKMILWVFILTYVAFWLSEGAAGVSVMDLVAKTIPERLRGRLFGLMHFVGGLLTAAAGLLTGLMLSVRGPSFPINYAILMSVGALLFAVSLAALSRVREPVGVADTRDRDFLVYVARIGVLLSGHRQLQRLLLVQLLIGSHALALPFYVLYARESGVGSGLIGVFLSLQAVGTVVAGGVAGYLSDQRGPKCVIVLTVFFVMAAPLLALLAGGASVWTYGLIFLLIGGVFGSSWIGLNNYLLELASAESRRSYIGLMNSANLPSMLFPFIGGLIVQWASYQAAFVVSAVLAVAALILALGLPSSVSGSSGRAV